MHRWHWPTACSSPISIAWFIGQQYFFIGVLLALWALGTGIVWPLGKGLARLAADPQVGSRALRVAGVVAALPLLLFGLLFMLPAPHHTRAKAVLSLPEQAILRAGSTGFVQRVVASPGSTVAAGAPIVHTDAPELRAEHRVQLAKVEEALARRDAAWGVQPAAVGRLEEDLKRERAALARLEQEIDQLTLRAQAAGTLLIEQAGDLPGRRLDKGAAVGLPGGQRSARAQGHRAAAARRPGAQRHPAGRACAWRKTSTPNCPAAWCAKCPRRARTCPAPRWASPAAATWCSTRATPRAWRRWIRCSSSRSRSTIRRRCAGWAAAPTCSFEHPHEPLGWRLWRAARRQLLSHFHV